MFTIDIIIGILKRYLVGGKIKLMKKFTKHCWFGRQKKMISEASQLSNSVTTLQEWGNMVIESSKHNISKGDENDQ